MDTRRGFSLVELLVVTVLGSLILLATNRNGYGNLCELITLGRTRAEKVAVVGSGPAGLACAYHLTRLGYGVTVFEEAAEAGCHACASPRSSGS